MLHNEEQVVEVHRIPINEKVNLDYSPIFNPRWGIIDYLNNLKITVGDLHANAKKLLYILKYHGFILISDPDYKLFCQIYNKKINDITQNDINTLKEIIERIEINPKAYIALLRLMGDELADRGSNDYFVLKILEKLALNKIQVTIILSNHGMNFIRCIEKVSEFEAPEMPEFSPSIYNLQQLIDRNFITDDEIYSIYKKCYLPHIKAIDYTIGKDNRLTIYTHAPSGRNFIRLLVEDINFYCNKQLIEYKDNTTEELANTIDQINKYIIELANTNQLSTLCEVNNKVLQEIIWNRDYNSETLGRSANDRYVSGHDLGYYIDDEYQEKVYHDEAKKENVRILDNECGKTDIYSSHPNPKEDDEDENYKIDYCSDEKQHDNGVFYSETNKELIDSTYKLLQDYGLENINIPVDKNYNYYNSFYNILLLLNHNKLVSVDNIKNVLTSKCLQSDINLKLFERCLIETNHAGILTQSTFELLLSKDQKKLKNFIIYNSLYNLIFIVKPNTNPEQIRYLNYGKLNKILRCCENNKQINLNELVYDFIFSNLDKVNVMAEKITSCNNLAEFISSVGPIQAKNFIVGRTVKIAAQCFNISAQQDLQFYYQYYFNCFGIEALIVMESFLNTAFKYLINGKMPRGLFNDINSQQYISCALRIWNQEEINTRSEPDLFEEIFCNPQTLDIFKIYSIYYSYNPGDVSYMKTCLGDILCLVSNEILTNELIEHIKSQPNPNVVMNKLRILSEEDLLDEDNVEIMIDNPDLDEDELLTLIGMENVESEEETDNNANNETDAMSLASNSSSASISTTGVNTPIVNEYNYTMFSNSLSSSMEKLSVDGENLLTHEKNYSKLT